MGPGVDPGNVKSSRRNGLTGRVTAKARPRRARTVGAVAVLAAAGVVPAGSAAGASPTYVATASCRLGGGWESTAGGTVAAFGGTRALGSVGVPLARPVVAMAATPDCGGYWLTASDGGVFAFGDARFYGSTGAVPLARPVVAMAATPDGRGYWLAASDGGVFAFGDARFYGSTGGVRLVRPVVAMASTPDGRGYWLAASDGGVFGFGDARFHGSTGGVALARPVMGMVPTRDGGGYWLVAADGGVFSFGDARFAGSLGGRPGVTLAGAVPAGDGYELIQSDGAVASFTPAVSATGVPGRSGSGSTSNRAHSSPTTVPTTTTSTVPTTTTTVPVTTTTTVPVTTTATVPVTTTTVAPTTTTTVAGPPAMTLGVMEADPQWMSADQAAGVREAMINIDWSQWQPQAGVTDSTYVAQQVATADQYRANGWTVAVDIGLQAPPAWALALTDGQLVDQNGNPSGSADYEYSAAVRHAASAYIASVVAAMGPVSSYRIGLGGAGEMMYPDAPNNQWWAYSASAQHGGADLPAGLAPSPMPGWLPGASTWGGATVTSGQVASWYGWYYGALVNALAWEINSFRAAGYAGGLQLLMPGDGAVPALYNQQLAADLAPSAADAYHTMNTGTVWWRLLPDLASQVSLANTSVDITSVYDGSGSPRGNACSATDGSTALASADPWQSGWSDTRWLTYLAHRQGLPVMGENPGNTAPADVSPTISLARSCGLTGLQWAWDYQLHSGSSTVASLSQLATAWSASA